MQLNQHILISFYYQVKLHNITKRNTTEPTYWTYQLKLTMLQKGTQLNQHNINILDISYFIIVEITYAINTTM